MVHIGQFNFFLGNRSIEYSSYEGVIVNWHRNHARKFRSESDSSLAESILAKDKPETHRQLC